MAEVVRIQLRRGTAAQWTQANPTLAEGEFGIETDTGKFKIGDGITAWNSIVNYFEPLDLSGYATTDDLDDYPTNSDLTTTLSSYLTTSSASSIYQTQAAMSLYAALSGATFTGPVILNADPTAPLGAATKEYVDNVASGILAKPAVLAATTTNLAGTYNNGTNGVGSTLNLGQLATLDIDGVTSWNQYDGLLLKDQTNSAQNGRWVMDQVGNGTDTDWILRRCGLCDEPSEIPGMYIFVTDGTVNGGTGWVAVVEDPATFAVGIDDINMYNFTSSTSYTAGSGISIAGNAISVDNTVAILTGTQTLTNKTLTLPNLNSPIIRMPIENVTVFAGAESPNVFIGQNNNTSVFYFPNPIADVPIFYVPFGRTPNGSAVTYSVIFKQGATPREVDTNYIYINNDYIISTINWLGGSAPTPSANTISVYTITVLQNGDGTSINHFTSFGSMATYGG